MDLNLKITWYVHVLFDAKLQIEILRETLSMSFLHLNDTLNIFHFICLSHLFNIAHILGKLILSMQTVLLKKQISFYIFQM